jgi:uncharacterized protein YaiL (DUF2058 family)
VIEQDWSIRMSHSLRDQLLGLGYQPAKPERKPEPPRKHGVASRPAQGAARGRPDARRQSAPVAAKRTQEEIDLAKAYALRAQKEKEDRLATERLKQEEASKKREAKAKLTRLLEGKALNDPSAELVRHFEYGGKIKRIHVTAEQLIALNAGELGVVQANGRYELVSAILLSEIESVLPTAVALKVDPNANASEDPHDDPAHAVPDDLVW